MADSPATSVSTVVPSLENKFSNVAQDLTRARSSSMVSLQGVQVDIDDAVNLVELFDFVAATIVLAGSINEGNLSFQSTCERYNTASDVPASSQENNDNSQYQITPSTDHFPVNMNISQFITFDDGTRIKVIQSIVNDLKNNQTEITELQGVGKLLRDFWMVYTQKKQLHEVKYLGLVQRSNNKGISRPTSESQSNTKHADQNSQKKKRFNTSSWLKGWNKKSGNTTGLNQLTPAKETSNARNGAMDISTQGLHQSSDTTIEINQLVNGFLEEYICKEMRDKYQVTAEIVDSMPRNNSTKLENNSPKIMTLKFSKLPENAQQQETQDSETTKFQAEELNNNLQGAYNGGNVDTDDLVLQQEASINDDDTSKDQNQAHSDDEREGGLHEKGSNVVIDGSIADNENYSGVEFSDEKIFHEVPLVMAIKPQEKEEEQLKPKNQIASSHTFKTDAETKSKGEHSPSINNSDQVLKDNLNNYLKSKWTGKRVSWLKRLLGAIARFFKRRWSGGAKKDFSTQSIKMVNELLNPEGAAEKKDNNVDNIKATIIDASANQVQSAKQLDSLIDRFKTAHTKLLSDYMKQHYPKKIFALEVTEKKEEAKSALKRNINYYGARLYAYLPIEESSTESTPNATDFPDSVLKALEISNG